MLGQPHFLVRCVQELSQVMKPYVAFMDDAILEGATPQGELPEGQTWAPAQWRPCQLPSLRS